MQSGCEPELLRSQINAIALVAGFGEVLDWLHDFGVEEVADHKGRDAPGRKDEAHEQEVDEMPFFHRITCRMSVWAINSGIPIRWRAIVETSRACIFLADRDLGEKLGRE